MGNPFLHNGVVRALCPKTYNLIRLQNHIMWSAPAVEADQTSSCKGYRRVFPWKHSVVVKCTLWSAPSLKTFCAKTQRQTQILQSITIQIFCSHLISSRIHPQKLHFSFLHCACSVSCFSAKEYFQTTNTMVLSEHLSHLSVYTFLCNCLFTYTIRLFLCTYFFYSQNHRIV